MDMEEYFALVQSELEDIIKKIENIGTSDYQPRAIEAKKKALEALKELYNEFEF